MFGNRAGWLISLVFVALYGGFAWWLMGLGEAAELSAVGRNAAESTLVLTSDPQALASNFITSDEDSGPLYRQAILDFESHRDTYAEFDSRKGAFARLGQAGAHIEPPAGLLLLRQATAAAKATIFAGDYAKYLDGKYNTDQIKILSKLGNEALTFANYCNAAMDAEDARAYSQAAFSLGLKMFNERIVWDEMSSGLGLMNGAAATMEGLVDSAEKPRWSDFQTQNREFYKKRIDAVYRAVYNINSARAGDMIALAEQSPEKMWRIEAIRTLGRCRFTTGTTGDQRSATRTLKRFAKDPDPQIRYAAKCALEMTAADVQLIPTVESEP